MGSLEVRNIVICPQCGHTEFLAKTQCSVSVRFYIDNNIIYPETDVFDTDDDKLTDIVCANCDYELTVSYKSLPHKIKEMGAIELLNRHFLKD